MAPIPSIMPRMLKSSVCMSGLDPLFGEGRYGKLVALTGYVKAEVGTGVYWVEEDKAVIVILLMGIEGRVGGGMVSAGLIRLARDKRKWVN
jgi:hypothetical protein